MSSRRKFLQIIPVAGATVLAGRAFAQAPNPVVDEKEPQAVALGYVTDAKRVDKKKFPKYAPPQHCGNCQLYQAAATVPSAPCVIFANRKVAAPGWCSAWIPKPA